MSQDNKIIESLKEAMNKFTSGKVDQSMKDGGLIEADMDVYVASSRGLSFWDEVLKEVSTNQVAAPASSTSNNNASVAKAVPDLNIYRSVFISLAQNSNFVFLRANSLLQDRGTDQKRSREALTKLQNDLSSMFVGSDRLAAAKLLISVMKKKGISAQMAMTQSFLLLVTNPPVIRFAKDSQAFSLGVQTGASIFTAFSFGYHPFFIHDVMISGSAHTALLKKLHTPDALYVASWYLQMMFLLIAQKDDAIKSRYLTFFTKLPSVLAASGTVSAFKTGLESLRSKDPNVPTDYSEFNAVLSALPTGWSSTYESIHKATLTKNNRTIDYISLANDMRIITEFFTMLETYCIDVTKSMTGKHFTWMFTPNGDIAYKNIDDVGSFLDTVTKYKETNYVYSADAHKALIVEYKEALKNVAKGKGKSTY